MSVIETLAKMIDVIVKTHPNPAAPIQELYDCSTNKREKEEIVAMSWGFGIKINEEEK